MQFKILDARPEVGIFEIVDGVFLKSSEEAQTISRSGEFFEGEQMHLHAQDIKTLVKYTPGISNETKLKFEKYPNEYLNYPRGRVDYNTRTCQYHIMAAKKFFTQENVERVTREFHLPPYASDKIVLEGDDGHYGY